MKKILQGIFFSLMLMTTVVAWAQNNAGTGAPIDVKGTVKDDKGQPLDGATILVKGTQIGTKSDVNGNFSIKAAPKSVLVISFVGFELMEVAVSASITSYDISMVPSGMEDQSVVVTALGIKRSEKALGYATQKVSGDVLTKVSGVDVATSLTGKVAGLLVRNPSDFGVAPVISIRGETPLLVIDGVPYANKTLSDISSEDIESLDVLKGPTASALYGFRGSSGAILVTTKKGSANATGITVDFASNNMFTAGYLALPEKQSVYGRGSNNTYDKNSDNSWGAALDGTVRNQWDPFAKVWKDAPYLPVGKDNFTNFLEQGYVTNNNLNLTYREGNASLRGSVNFVENKGRYPNSTLDQFTYSFGADINLKKLKLSTNLSYTKRHTPNLGSNGYTSYDPMYSLLIWSSADFNILDYKDNYWITPGIQQNYIFGLNPNGTYSGANQNNPYFDRYEKTNEVSRDIFNADLTMSYQLTNWLNATARAGIDYYTDQGTQRISRGSYLATGNTPTPGNLYTWNGTLTGGYVTGQNQGRSLNTDFILSGDRSIDKFKFEYLAGGTIYYKQDDNVYGNTVGGISVPGFFSLKASVNPAFVSETTQAQQVNSLFGRLAVSWNNLLFLEGTGRNDWSSTLATENPSYFYPSVAASFIASELLPGTRNWLDLLKFRGAWTMSKTPPGIYAINSSYGINSGTWGTLNGATAPSNLYGDGLLPESAKTFELGLQALMYKGRLGLDVTYYDKNMYDFLRSAQTSATSGYTGNFINTDEAISRRGWEVALNGSPIKKKDFQWDLGLNWSTFRRVYTALDATYSAKRPWVAVGERVDVFFSRAFLTVPETGERIYNNGRLQVSQYDSKFGYSDPDWLWGVNSNLRYKNWSLFFSFDGVSGGLMNSRTDSYLWQSGNHPNSVTDARAKDVATPGSMNYIGKGVKIISGTVTYDAMGNITSDTRKYAPNDIASTYKQAAIDLHNSSAWGGNGSSEDTYSKTFTKLREVSLTYQLPAKYTQGWARAASVGFVGQNVMLWAKDFKYSDPDGGGAREDFSDPAVRYLGFNVKVTF